MNKVFVLLVGIAVLGGVALVYLATGSTKSLVLVPSDLIKDTSHKDIQRLRVGGKVSNDEVQYSLQPEIVLSFKVEDPTDPQGSIPVIYKGLKPDMFAAGRSVMIDGDYVGGTIIATKLLTQCPSKYEPPLPEEHKKS